MQDICASGASSVQRRNSRLLSLSILLSSLGSGLFITGASLYLITIMTFDEAGVGFGMTVSLGVALLVMFPVGKITDRYGGHKVYGCSLLLQGAALLGYQFVRDYPTFIITAMLVSVCDRAQNAATGGLIGQAVTGTERVGIRARLRALSNVGISFGALLGGAALQIGTETAFRCMLLGDAIACIMAALCVVPIRLVSFQLERDESGSRPSVLSDGRYLRVALFNAAISLHFDLISYIIPIWIALHTGIPSIMVSAVVILDTIIVIVFQMPISRRYATVRAARNGFRITGALLAVSCIVMSGTERIGGWFGTVIVVAWVLIYGFAEVCHSSCEFAVSFGLAREEAIGEYQALFSLCKGVSNALAPTVLTMVILGGGAAGWLAGGVFLSVSCSALSWYIRRSVDVVQSYVPDDGKDVG